MEQNTSKNGTVVPFPLCRQELLVRETVYVLMRRHGAAADRFWNTTIRRLTGQLQVCGVRDSDEISDQIEAFSLTVFDRVRKEAAAAADQHVGGAA
ncbi:hypothetical protein J1C56_09120 [Aminobacter anthyllidis]|uniref:Uncharacterized protein n=1 Tax=Aminobacter anthyllidis TaxID=1035067 RepID=A0A9X1AA72_9HYPH|nr:DUF6074 family protein [Aminobacter anthyllidis]MBT1155752.1 hypothetical protein [Aminobacter anthyllidis]